MTQIKNFDFRPASTAELPATPIPSSRPTANFSARSPIEHQASEKYSGVTSAFQTRLLPPSQPRGRWDLLSHVPKISICSPAQAAALEVRSLTPHWLDSLSLPKVLFFISSKASRPLLSWPCGFVAVFFCFSGVFLRLKPPLLHRDDCSSLSTYLRGFHVSRSPGIGHKVQIANSK